MATSSDLTLLLREIVTHPEDDTVRLAYADLVQEQGDDERAEFIRVQVELSRIPNPPPEPERGEYPDSTLSKLEALQGWRRQWSPRYYEFRERERRLRGIDTAIAWPSNVYDWFIASLPRGLEVAISRGFISSLTATAEDFLACCDSLIWHPEQTIPCPLQCVNGWHENSGSSGDWKCKGCERGLVSRTFPDTAQPITDVTLTTHLLYEEWGDFQHTNGVYTFKRWPGVNFTLTPLPNLGSGYADPNATYIPQWDTPLVPPVVAEPQPASYPTHSWHIEREYSGDIPVDGGTYENPSTRQYVYGQTSFTLTVRVPYDPDATRLQLGETLRNLLATDRAGREYRVPTAILTRYEKQVLRQRYQSPTDIVLLTAVATSTPVPL